MSALAVDFNRLEGVQMGDELIVRFKPEATADCVYILAMNAAGVLKLNTGDLMFYEAVRETGDWDGDHNRTQTLVLGPRWNYEFFVGRMRRALESLEVRKQN